MLAQLCVTLRLPTGPCTYVPTLSNGSPKWTFGSATRTNLAPAAVSPGPGESVAGKWMKISIYGSLDGSGRGHASGSTLKRGTLPIYSAHEYF